MRVPLSWINEFVDVQSVVDLSEKLLFSGIEVDSVKKVGEFAEQYRVVEVIEVGKKENIRLPVCLIYDGNSKYEVLTGAKNIKNGKFIWCPPGSKVKKGDEIVEIGVKKVRDISSYGMLLSPAEIGFPDSEEDKLLELPNYVQVGAKASDIFNLPDFIIDISITPQRGDLLSVLGLSVEISAITGRKLKFDVEKIWDFSGIYSDLKDLRKVDLFDIVIDNEDACKLYFGGLFSGNIRNAVSSPLVISRLYMCGGRPINPIVDATNYVLFEVGQPTHVFDFDKIGNDIKKKIIVRNAKNGEKILCLDGKERVLSEHDLVIADEDQPIAIAGVIGGERSSVSYDTKRVLLESAFFSPRYIRRTSKLLGVETESSYRFARRVSPSGVLLAFLRIKDIFLKEGLEFLGYNIAGNFEEFKNKKIRSSISFFSEYTGANIDKESIKSSLSALRIKVYEEGEDLLCDIPIWRGDINLKEDLVEEVVRIVGYDKIPKTIPKVPSEFHEKDFTIRDHIEKIRDMMAFAGYVEVKTYPFSKVDGIAIKNPITSDFAFFSDKLEDRIKDVVIKAFKNGVRNIRIFEIEKDISGSWILSFGICGYSFPQKWTFQKDKKVDIFDAKEIFEILFPPVQLTFSKPDIRKDGFSFEVFIEEIKIGDIIYEHSSEILEDIFVGKIYLDRTLGLINRFGRFHSDLPLIERDISFFLKDDNVVWADVRKLFFVSEKIIDVFVFDVWEKDKKSITARVVINQGSKTMTSEEINQLLNKIISNLKQNGFEARVSQ